MIELSQDDLRLVALRMLQGVGEAERGEWGEWTGVAYHLRRRLSENEQARIGEAIDLRGTPEAMKRYLKATPLQQKYASQELGI